MPLADHSREPAVGASRCARKAAVSCLSWFPENRLHARRRNGLGPDLLLKLCDDELTAGGMKVYRHSLTPPNDGGLALGQAIYGMYALSNKQ